MEFKSELPSHSDLAKTAIAFANDAGGDIYIGITDSPREVVGVTEDLLPAFDEQISNIIFDRCYPTIIAPVFKHLGLIDQWGNGLKLVAREMKIFPNIKLKWKEIGQSFQIQFAIKGFSSQNNIADNTINPYNGKSGGQTNGQTTDEIVLELIRNNPTITRAQISQATGKAQSYIQKCIEKLKAEKRIVRIGPSTFGGEWRIIE